jgi:hypothetical protein
VEISTPSARRREHEEQLSASSSARLPRTGTPKTAAAIATTVTALTKPRTRYGSTLPTMICHGRSGETSSTSIVPISFSRVSEIAVISAQTIVSTKAIRPGTKRFDALQRGVESHPHLGDDPHGPAARRASRS